jgi:hypothetical protein
MIVVDLNGVARLICGFRTKVMHDRYSEYSTRALVGMAGLLKGPFCDGIRYFTY